MAASIVYRLSSIGYERLLHYTTRYILSCTMRRQHFYILLSLADRDRHGSAIMRDVLALTDGALKLWPVTLYGSLDELADEGLIRALDSAPLGADEPPGHTRWFRITASGRRALSREVTAMQSVVRQAERRLATKGEV